MPDSSLFFSATLNFLFLTQTIVLIVRELLLFTFLLSTLYLDLSSYLLSIIKFYFLSLSLLTKPLLLFFIYLLYLFLFISLRLSTGKLFLLQINHITVAYINASQALETSLTYARYLSLSSERKPRKCENSEYFRLISLLTYSIMKRGNAGT